MSGPFKVVIDNETAFSSSTRIELRNGTVIAKGYKPLTHNTDGTRSFDVYIEGGIWTSVINCKGEKKFTLDAIPRDAKVTEASDFTDNENPWIKVSNPAGHETHYLWLEPSPPNPTKHLCLRTDNVGDGSTFTWELSETEREALRNNCTGPSCTIRLGMYYKVGSETKATYLDKTFTVEESNLTRPEVTMEVARNNGSLPAKFADLWIQGKSRVDVSLSAEGKYNATISRYSAQVDGKTYIEQEFTSDAIQNSGNVEIIGYAKDSREITGSDAQTVNVIEYSKPLVIPGDGENAILCYRSDGNGKRIGNSTSVWVKAKRFYYSVEGKNTCSLQYRVKPAADLWASKHQWNGLLYDDAQSDEYIGLIPDEVFDLKTSYTVQIMAIDDIGEYDIKTFEIPTQDVALHLGKGGKNVAVGTYCDTSKPYTFYSEWDAIFDKSINGAYIQAVQLSSGNSIRLQSCFEDWSDDGTDQQSFLVFGNMDAYAALGVCVVQDTGQITEDSITNITADVAEKGVVLLRTEYDNNVWLVIMSPRPFTIL